MQDKSHKPPLLAERFLLLFLREELVEEVLGDLDEKFYLNLNSKSPLQAKINYWLQVLNYFRPFALKSYKSKSNYTAMYQHNFKIAYRNFFRYKTTFFINLIGLSTGLASALVIYLWVADELNVDKFHDKDDRLYQVMLNVMPNDEIVTLEWTPNPLHIALKEQMPEVENVAAIFPPSPHTFDGVLEFHNEKFKAKSKYVGKDFFKIFSHPLIEGRQDQLMDDKYGVAISDELATKVFGETKGVVGKSFKWNMDNLSGDFFVSGIFESMPNNGSIQFDIAFNYDLYAAIDANFNSWTYNNPCTYVTLKEGSDLEHFQSKIHNLIQQNDPEATATLFARQYSSQYLYSNYENGVAVGGRISYVILFSIIAAFVLLTACINFMNLSTARASRRVKEIGVKKSIGAKRSDLIIQHFMESQLMALLSLIVAILLTLLVLPMFNMITGKELHLTLSFQLILPLIAIAFVTGLLAGSYPALYLSGIKPINIFKGGVSTSLSTQWIRKGLVVFQFINSLVLIVAVFVISGQMDYIQERNLGLDKENIIYFNERIKNDESFVSFKHQLGEIPGVTHVSSISGDITTGDRNNTTGIQWEGQVEGHKVDFSDVVVDYNFFETMGIEVDRGRKFSESMSMEKDKIIFNETAINEMGLTDPIGKIVKLWGSERQIVGIVKDFHLESLYKKVKPSFFRLANHDMNTLVKIEQGHEHETLIAIEKMYKEHNDGLSLDYNFVDDAYDKLYASEKRVSILSKYFAGLAIVISCLGLFGLAAFTTEIRLKEIGIRKVLGAGNRNIIMLLSNDYTKMVIIANLIALPIGYFLTKNWLASFAFRINLEWWFFAASGIIVLMITWLTVSFQTIKAAMVNPVDCLKDE